MSRVPATTHTCPVCGHTGPCTQSAGETGQFRYHNCHVCGSTWKEQKVQDPADKDSKPLQTAKTKSHPIFNPAILVNVASSRKHCPDPTSVQRIIVERERKTIRDI